MEKKKTVGLVLGSGASRGWAHIGALEALDEAGIPVGMIAGCSVGSYVGTIYASGGLASLKEFVLRMDGKKVFSYFDVVFPRHGLLDGTRKLGEMLSMHTAATTFEELSIPLVMVATDLAAGDKVVLKSGDLFVALRATMSMPGLFAPVRIQGRWLVDGGLVDPVPVSIARAMGADVVIAVDLNSGLVSRQRRDRLAAERDTGVQEAPGGEQSEFMKKLSEYYDSAESVVKKKIREVLNLDDDMPNIMDTVGTAIGIMQERITRINLAVDPPDILIQPRLGELRMMDFDQVEKAIEEGYLGMQERMADIRMMLG
ncbi:MAG: patatin-like phospholipase family protein [Pseudomonadota bacterium]